MSLEGMEHAIQNMIGKLPPAEALNLNKVLKGLATERFNLGTFGICSARGYEALQLLFNGVGDKLGFLLRCFLGLVL